MPLHRAALTCVLIALSPAWATAQPAPLVRSWVVPDPACGDAARLDAEVARLLGGDPNGQRRAVRVQGTIRRTDDGRLSLALRIEDAEGQVLGTRTLTATDCAPLAEAAALLTALTVDPGAVAEASSEPPALPRSVSVEAASGLDAPLGSRRVRRDGEAPPESEVGPRESASGVGSRESASASEVGSRESASASAVGARESASASESNRWPTTFALDGSLFLDVGPLPAAAAGVSLGARLSRRRLRVGVHAAALLPRATAVARSGRSDASARFYGLAARLEVGGGFSRGVVLLEGGAVAELMVLSGASAGVSAPDRGFGALLFLGAQARVLLRLGRVAVGLEGDLRAPTSRPRFEIRGLGAVHRPSALAGRVGLVVRYPARP